MKITFNFSKFDSLTKYDTSQTRINLLRRNYSFQKITE